MSHLLRRTKKSCLKLLRKISTSKQLFVQRLDEDGDEDDEYMTDYDVQQQQQQTPTDKQYSNNNNNNDNLEPEPEPSIQYLEYACDASTLENDEQEQPELELSIQFDLMHYKENVRYLRHTPSNSSLQLEDLATPQTGNYRNVIIMEQQPPNENYPIVKWDINGNSLNEEHQFDLRRHWDAFDNRWRQLQALQTLHGKRKGSGHSHTQSQSQSHTQSQRSSHHSSSCTLETWIDDAELGLCDESQNLLQSNHNNNNNNNCNQCLKSF